MSRGLFDVEHPYRGSRAQTVNLALPARVTKLRLPARAHVAGVSTIVLHAVLLCVFALTSKVEAKEPPPSVTRLVQLTPPMPIAIAPVVDAEPLTPPMDDRSRVEYYRERDERESSCGWACSTADQADVDPEYYTSIGIATKPAGSCAPTFRAHRVQAGETLTSIAHDYGFDDFRALYNKEVNFDLYYERPDPNLIMVDDLVVIPPAPGTRYCFLQ